MWPASSYYKITIGATIKGTSNIGVEIAKVKFVEGASGGGCSNQVNITNSSTTSVTHGSFDVDKTGSQDACSALSVTVTPNPDDHYHVATVSATNPATTGTAGAAMYNGDGTYTITYSANAKGNSTISVTFAADPTYTVTWVAGSNPSFSTQTNYAGTALSDPEEPSAASYCPGGKEFVGWTATPIVGEDDEAPGDLFTSVAGKSIPEGGTTYYAVFATNGGGSDPVTDTEHGKTSTPYVANEGWTASAGGTYTSSGNYSVSPSIKFSSNNNYVQSPTYADAITNVTFWHKNQAGAGYLKIYVSTDGSSFTELTGERITLTANQYTVGTKDIDLDYEDGYKAVKIVFDRTSGNCCIDEIAVTYGGGASYSDYATTCASCNSNPSAGTASLNGSFSLTSVGVQATSASSGANCTYSDYGFLWSETISTAASLKLNESTGAAPSGATKVPVGNSGNVTSFTGALEKSSFEVGHTYYYRSYAHNNKDAGTYQYSSVVSFTPRSVTFNLNGHGTSTPSTQYVNNGGNQSQVGRLADGMTMKVVPALHGTSRQTPLAALM